jgi:hypothetical protein
VATSVSPPCAIIVVHHNKAVLRAVRLLAILRLVPRCITRLVSDGKALGDAFAAGHVPAGLTIVPSNLYIRYHLEVPAITAVRGFILV